MVIYRTSMQIVGDLLTATQDSGEEGIKTTRLLAQANLSHSRLSKFLENLTGSGLVNKIEYDGKNTFVITPKGRQYLESYMQFSILHAILRCCRRIWIRTLNLTRIAIKMRN
jgi:predicted transcriptional regulator